jgi:hypothetical protein
MTIADHMAKTIRAAVLSYPEKVSPELYESARNFAEAYQQWKNLTDRESHPYKYPYYTEKMKVYRKWQSAYADFRAMTEQYSEEIKAL